MSTKLAFPLASLEAAADAINSYQFGQSCVGEMATSRDTSRFETSYHLTGQVCATVTKEQDQVRVEIQDNSTPPLQQCVSLSPLQFKYLVFIAPDILRAMEKLTHLSMTEKDSMDMTDSTEEMWTMTQTNKHTDVENHQPLVFLSDDDDEEDFDKALDDWLKAGQM